MSCLRGLRFLISATANDVSSSLVRWTRQRLRALSGDDVLHGARIGVEGRRNLGGIESAEPAARARAYVDQATTLAKSRDNNVDGVGDLRQSAGYGGSNGRAARRLR